MGTARGLEERRELAVQLVPLRLEPAALGHADTGERVHREVRQMERTVL